MNRLLILVLIILSTLSAGGAAKAGVEVNNSSSTFDLVTLVDNQIAIYFQLPPDSNNNIPDYNGWGLHLWNGEGCDNYGDATASSSHFGDWANPYPFDGIDEELGAYVVLDYAAESANCLNFIIHKGDEKALGESNSKFDLTQLSRHAFTKYGSSTVLYDPADLTKIFLTGASAHWIESSTLLLPSQSAAEVRVYYSKSAQLHFDSLLGIKGNNYLSFMPTQSQVQIPHLAHLTAYETSASTDKVKDVLTNELIAIAYSADKAMLSATRIQTAGVLDDLYTSADNDADEAQLGVVYNGNKITTSVWAPTAKKVKLKVYNAQKQLLDAHMMVRNKDSGVWSYNGNSALNRLFYRYEVTVYHPVSGNIEKIEATDPYSVSLSTNGRFSQFVNLSDDDLKPADWDNHQVPTIENFEQAVIVEGHIRDFSIRDLTTTAANRGKYLAFTETNSDAVQHLKGLVDSGVTHFHMLPVNDIASINEEESGRIELTSTVGQLCAVNNSAPVCSVANNNDVILDLLQSYDPASQDAQALVNSMRDLDGFNWGYDPHHFNAPEGSYASNPEGVSRILEMRKMNQALHENGLRVVLDVVYNHTASSGLWDNSVFDKIVPGYYHRYDIASGDMNRSTCCENTATEHKMMDKFVSDSLVLWAKEYKFDSFRFDLMGHMPKSTILSARDAVAEVDPDTYFYGEGWNFGEVANDRLFEQATQYNMSGTEVGLFNDRPRDVIRGAALSKSFVSLGDVDHIRLGLAGTQRNYVLVDEYGNNKRGEEFPRSSYGLDPADIINYVSKHDNETLWDQLQYSLPQNMTAQDRVRTHNISASIPLLSQGIPFFQLGVEMMRSKSMDRNTYNSGDWFNFVDYTNTTNNWNVGLPLSQDNNSKWSAISALIANSETTVYSSDINLSEAVFNEFLQIRSSSKLFSLTTESDIISRIGFHNTGAEQTPGLVVMSIDDGAGLADLDPNVDAMVVVINGTDSLQNANVRAAKGFTLHSIQANSADSLVQASTFVASYSKGTFSVPAYTTAVFVKEQANEQGTGLKPIPDEVPAPYGDAAIYLRGIMGDWNGLTNEFEYIDDGIYQYSIELTVGDYEFKVADSSWGSINLGFWDVSIGVDSLNISDSWGNMKVQIAQDDTYLFTIDASGTTPIVSVSSETPIDVAPYGNTTVYLRGLMGDWGTSAAMDYVGNGVYEYLGIISAGVHEFKIADSGWGLALGFYEVDFDNNSLSTVVGSDGNIQIQLPEQALYKFTIDASGATPVVSVTLDSPTYGDTAIYLRGSMNGWRADVEMEYIGNGIYRYSTMLSANSYEFKIAEDPWGGIELGFWDVNIADDSITVGESWGNMQVQLSESAIHVFTLDTSGSTPVISVTVDEPFYGDTTIYVRGTMNGWDANADMEYNGNSVYSYTTTLSPNTYEFKIASFDWNTVNLGFDSVLFGSDSLATNNVGNNHIEIVVTQETEYQFIIDISSGSPVVSVIQL